MKLATTDTLPFRHATHGDVVTLARLLLTYPDLARYGTAEYIIDSAMMGERHRRETGKSHIDYGRGTIHDAVSFFVQREGIDLPPEPGFSDTDYIDCWITALTAIRNAISAADRAWDRLQAEAV